MNQTVILGALELGGIFAILSLGLYISYKVLNLPDLTVDGSFALGCAVSGMFTINSMPYVGLIGSFVIGAAAGVVTGLLITKFKIMPLLSGILTMTGLYSINLAIMNDTPNLSLFGNNTIFSSFTAFDPYGKIILIYLIVIVICVILDFFLRTQLGLSLRACGDNEDMVRASSIDTDKMKILGLALANGLVAMSGAVFAQHQSFADISSGTGMMVIGLASIIVGTTFIKKEKIIFQLVAVVFGAIFYRAVLTVALQLGLPSGYLKLLSAVLVIVAIASTNGDVSVVFNEGTVNEKVALNNINLALDKGDFVTIIGSNGAGKSTLFQAISGAVDTKRGNIILNGRDITFEPEYKRSKGIGRLFQDPLKGTAPNMTIEENLHLSNQRGKHFSLSLMSHRHREEFKKALMELELGLEERLDSKVGLLSGGQRQALTLLMATLVTPDLLLLDEHTAALDPKTALKVLELSQKIVEEHQITTLMITHNMEDALKYGNKTMIMKDGQIIAMIEGKEREEMTVEGLIHLYSTSSQEYTDRVLLK